MKVLVCGGRDFDNPQWLYRTLDIYHQKYKFTTLIHGGAPGVDFQASMWAVDRAVRAQQFEADWKKFGHAAGPLRNQRMINEGKPDLVIAFPGNTGTADMVRRARTSKIEVLEISPVGAE